MTIDYSEHFRRRSVFPIPVPWREKLIGREGRRKRGRGMKERKRGFKFERRERMETEAKKEERDRER